MIIFSCFMYIAFPSDIGKTVVDDEDSNTITQKQLLSSSNNMSPISYIDDINQNEKCNEEMATSSLGIHTTKEGNILSSLNFFLCY